MSWPVNRGTLSSLRPHLAGRFRAPRQITCFHSPARWRGHRGRPSPYYKPSYPISGGGLTLAQVRVAELVVDGLSTVIAGTLSMSPRSVEAHLTKIYRNLGSVPVRNSSSAVSYTRERE
jgi:DNA-binding NarL/FixJ family response regulator